MRNVCFRALRRHVCLRQYQEGRVCPNSVVSEAKHFFFCWLFRICAISHMCTSLVSSKAVAHISWTWVLLSAEIHNTLTILSGLLFLYFHIFHLEHFLPFITSKLSEPSLPRHSPSLCLSAVDIVAALCPFGRRWFGASQHLVVMLNACLVSSPWGQIANHNQLQHLAHSCWRSSQESLNGLLRDALETESLETLKRESVGVIFTMGWVCFLNGREKSADRK